MKYFFKHPNKFKFPKYNVGDEVWIIEDELQEDGTFIDKVKSAKIVELEPYWFKWWFIHFWIFNKVINLLPYYEQLESVHLQNSTVDRWQSDLHDVFSTKEEAQKWFDEHNE